MQTRHWQIVLMCGFLWIGSDSAWSQYAPPQQSFYQNEPQPYFGPPPAMGQMGGMEQQPGWPEEGQQWPYVSPFMNGLDQTYQEDGLWVRKVRGTQRHYFFTMEALYGRYGGPRDNVVGDPGARYFVQASGRASFLTESGGATGGTGTTAVTAPADGEPGRAPFHYGRMGLMEDEITSGGLRGTFGWFSDDDTGFAVQGFWQGQGDTTFHYTLGGFRPQANSVIEAIQGISARFGVPVQDGTPAPTLFGGTQTGSTIPYDTLYSLQYSQTLYGSSAAWYFLPMLDRNAVKIRPLVGMRYMRLGETFRFVGIDSGLDYTFSPINYTPAGPTTIGSVTLPASGEFVGYITSLRSHVDSNIAGPEAGFRIDLGNPKFNIWLESKFGLMAVHSTRMLSGNNFGNGYAGALITPSVDNPAPNAFNLSNTTTKATGMFEQGIFLRSYALQYVPGIRKIPLFAEAQFQAGYTFQWVAQVYRPGDTIIYRGSPLLPGIADKTNQWSNQIYSMGVEWKF